jgi:hypothetical protein
MISVMPLIDCPFLKLKTKAASMPCCPRDGSQQDCPLSTSAENCPFFVTEAKLGIKVAKFQLTGLPVFVSPAPAVLFHEIASTEPGPDSPRGVTDLYLLNRVLLI